MVANQPRGKLPWLLVAASLVFAVLLGYVLFAGYLPAKQRMAQLESELRVEDLERELAAARPRRR